MTREEQFEARYWHLAGIPKIAAWQAWTAALERAAEVCETILDELSFANAYECSNECAAAIRALKDEE
jgi:hypothetical protein